MKRQGARMVHVGRVLSQGGLQGPGKPPRAWLCVCREDGGIQCAGSQRSRTAYVTEAMKRYVAEAGVW